MGLTLEWNNEQDALEIQPSLIEQLELLLKLAGQQEKVEIGEVALSFVTDEEIQQLNKQYRNLDRPTDVLSFAMQEMGEDELEIIYEEEAELVPLGDIIISIPRAIAQSEEYGHSVEREIGFLFIHGFLHLIGYDHGDAIAEAEMFAKQEQILQLAGLTR
ncbi:rRNA maturation RNase YbeY [Paenibacillus psychroresistens]|uniref:Endoribonuclease YbeY n=1 Tax=Paenibacillus psychroresistens TaxID=1778678 RepID=A0A6B8RIL4_9BACL|nr:rRNA maturation RNase YbeY [Paenibacillus psychroresistens]QGQ95727.1 rRNA maturation RNase YbeY [Paenibacillus psychroresistens]